eukprot:GHVO01018115.1.p1 GENE.GHVO01018115.1~~GHVO01018115.1.p1  ORF type:complete len:580 (+),score=103.26 GHVO01018115.1:65-1804(+)
MSSPALLLSKLTIIDSTHMEFPLNCTSPPTAFHPNDDTCAYTPPSPPVDDTNVNGNIMRPTESSSDKRLRIDEACQAIEGAEFVAIDLEFSGLFSSFKKCSDLPTHYKFCAENVKRFATMQLGVCAVSRNPDVPNGWIFTPFNFHLFPSQRSVFMCDSSSLRWLRTQGFNFETWIAQGFDYTRLEEAQDSSYYNGVQRIIGTIMSNSCPLIVHNGILDLMHIYDKFINNLPPTVSEFCKCWMTRFKGGVFDTKRIAQEGKHTILHLANLKHMGLEELRSHLLKRPGINSTFTITASSQTDNPEYSLSRLPAATLHSKAHEAGFDALATAQIFLLELELYSPLNRSLEDKAVGDTIRTDKRRKRPRNLSKDFSDNQFVIPLNWLKDLKICGDLWNVIELPNVKPGELRLKSQVVGVDVPRCVRKQLKETPSPPVNDLNPVVRRMFEEHANNAQMRKTSGELTGTVTGLQPTPPPPTVRYKQISAPCKDEASPMQLFVDSGSTPPSYTHDNDDPSGSLIMLSYIGSDNEDTAEHHVVNYAPPKMSGVLSSTHDQNKIRNDKRRRHRKRSVELMKGGRKNSN